MDPSVNFTTEYAPSDRAHCRGCRQNIKKGFLRISELEQSLDCDKIIPIWYHCECFFSRRRVTMQMMQRISQIDNFDNLHWNDQERIIKKLAKFYSNDDDSNNEADSSPVRTEGEICTDDKIETLKEQNEAFFVTREKIAKDLKTKEINSLLENNKQHVSKEVNKKLDLLAECLVFGALEACPKCGAALHFTENKYKCAEFLNVWVKCQYETKTPKRKEFVIPENLQEKFEDYKSEVRERLLRTTVDDFSVNLPLNGRTVVLLGDSLLFEKKQLKRLGATVQKRISAEVDLCIVSEEEIDSNEYQIAKHLKVDIVKDNFIKDIKELSLHEAVEKNILFRGGSDLLLKYGVNPERERQKAEAEKNRIFAKISPKKVMDIVKGPAVVYSEEYKDSCHVYREGKEVFSAALTKVDAYIGKNSFYYLQLLQSDSGSSYFLLRRWGRTGTIVDKETVQNFDDVESAKKVFQKVYLSKTKNEWKDRETFQKKPNAYYPEKMDYLQDREDVKQHLASGNSGLSKPVRGLIRLIFDIELMEMTMIEFEIDLNIMPLGNIIKEQILEAYGVLEKAFQILETDPENLDKITELSNFFFTLIPHALGTSKPPLLDKEKIKTKFEMLDSLLKMEIAYKIISQFAGDEDPVEKSYGKLKTDIEVIGKDTKEFQLIEKYIKNTCDDIKLDIKEVYKINRHDESKRYSKFKSLHNKKLLWHGSRVTNFAGILSEGLRIAPPEAKISGTSFGKGVYFADTVCKSTKYCGNKEGICLLLLCAVGLGDMYETTAGEFKENFIPGKHSTFGIGRRTPNPAETITLNDVEVPCGRLIKSKFPKADKKYNEYIVYDTNQINIRYLVEVFRTDNTRT